MVVRWSVNAENKLKNIFDYYLYNASYKVATKIVTNIIDTADTLAMMPFMGAVEEDLTGCRFIYRSLIVSKIFKVVYFIDEKAEKLVIATVWDCCQNPSKMQNELMFN